MTAGQVASWAICDGTCRRSVICITGVHTSIPDELVLLIASEVKNLSICCSILRRTYNAPEWHLPVHVLAKKSPWQVQSEAPRPAMLQWLPAYIGSSYDVLLLAS